MRKNILVVEDEPIFSQTIKSALAKQNFDVTVATNGEQAISILNSTANKFDLFLVDIKMPGMDGLELMTVIKSKDGYQDTPFVMLTADSERKTVLNAFKIGADNYLLKSDFSISKLLEVLCKKLKISF